MTKLLFLASSIDEVAHDIALQLPKPAKGQKLAFVTTASEVEEGDLWWLRADLQALADVGFDVLKYTITDKNEVDIREDLKDIDALCVGGGNTFYLLQETIKSGFDKFIKDFVASGKPYMGSSAGSVMAGANISMANGDDKIKAPDLKDYTGLGLVDFIIFPHWGSEAFRESYQNHSREITYAEDNKLVLLTNYQYVYVQGDWYQIMEVNH